MSSIWYGLTIVGLVDDRKAERSDANVLDHHLPVVRPRGCLVVPKSTTCNVPPRTVSLGLRNTSWNFPSTDFCAHTYPSRSLSCHLSAPIYNRHLTITTKLIVQPRPCPNPAQWASPINSGAIEAAAARPGYLPTGTTAAFLEQTRDPPVVAAILFVGAFATLIVASRSVARVFYVKKFGLDDWLALITLVRRGF